MENAYQRAVEKALDRIRKEGYITDHGLHAIFDEMLLSAMKPFIPPRHSGTYLFNEDFNDAMHKHLTTTFEGTPGILKKLVPDEYVDLVAVIYALDERNLTRGFKKEILGMKQKSV